MATPATTVIELSTEEALKFVQFQKRYAFFQMLESIDAFSVRNGSITVNFDNLGAITSVSVNQVFRP